LADQRTKRCHWVSRGYLRTFAVDPDKRSKIWRFSKSEGQAELKPIEKVAVKYHLYAPMKPDGKRDDRLEKKLSEIERWFGEPIWAAVCNDFPDFGWEPLRKMVALLVAITHVRNPLSFERWKNQHREMVLNVSRFPIGERLKGRIGDKTFDVNWSDWPTFRDATEEQMKADWNRHVGSCAEVAEILLKMRWAVLFCDQPVFVTSDNPVQFLHPSLKFKGVHDPETVVAFPLSPTRILMMDNRHQEPDSRYYRLNHDPASENMLIWRNAIEHMFSPRDPYQVCAEMLADAERMGVA
jgi:hypothetical protein